MGIRFEKLKIVAHCNVKPWVNKRQFIGFSGSISGCSYRYDRLFENYLGPVDLSRLLLQQYV